MKGSPGAREVPAPGLRRWLVTGGAGFVGSHLVEELLRAEREVVVLDDLSTGSRAKLAEVERAVGPARAARLDFVEGDVRDARRLGELVRGADVVLHQAALGSVPRSIDDPARTFEANARGSLAVLEAVRAARTPRLVYASSSSVYGDGAVLPRREAELGTPLSPYAATKRLAEIAAAVYARAYGVRAVGLRYFNLFGPRQDPRGPYAAVVPRWIQALIEGGTPVLHGDGTTARDFCPVANAVRANWLAAGAAERCAGRVYNIGLGRATTLAALFVALRAELVRLGVDCARVEPRHAAPRRGDVRASQADLALARAELGYAPVLELEPGLALACAAAVARAAAGAPTGRSS